MIQRQLAGGVHACIVVVARSLTHHPLSRSLKLPAHGSSRRLKDYDEDGRRRTYVDGGPSGPSGPSGDSERRAWTLLILAVLCILSRYRYCNTSTALMWLRVSGPGSKGGYKPSCCYHTPPPVRQQLHALTSACHSPILTTLRQSDDQARMRFPNPCIVLHIPVYLLNGLVPSPARPLFLSSSTFPLPLPLPLPHPYLSIFCISFLS